MKRIALLLALLLAACAPQAAPRPTATAEASATSAPAHSPTATERSAPTATPLVQIPVRFAVIGDYGLAGEHEAAVAELVKGWEPHFIVTTGDNNYPVGSAQSIDHNVGQYYHDYIGKYQGDYGEGSAVNRFFPSLGNHDWRAPDAQPYLDYFDLPGNERYYQQRWGPVELFIVDSDEHEPDGIGLSSAQAAWLQSALEASGAPWKLVVFHHTPYSSGRYGDNLALQWPFGDWGADAVLAGHEHFYERLEIDGLPYITNGLGGSDARYFFLRVRQGSLVRYRDAHGALFARATEDYINFEFVNVMGDVIDSLTLTADDQ